MGVEEEGKDSIIFQVWAATFHYSLTCSVNQI